MIFASRIILFLFLTLSLDGFNVHAQDLDIFKSSAPFPVDSMFSSDRLVNLETLPPEKIPEVLRQYLRAEKKSKNREKRNLLALAIGFLYLKKGDFPDAVRYFKKRILGNFILDDFKLEFQTAALVELAKQKLERKRYFSAIQNLLQSIKLRMKIYHSFPGSPFHQSLPRDLAETEKLLGDAYYRTFNYKPAWQAYRKALMRSFPGNEELRLEVYLALAKTYEAAKNFQEAADIYTYLLRNFNDPRAKQAIAHFAQKHKKRIHEKKIDAEFLLSAQRSKTDRRSGKESIPATPPSSSENKGIRDFNQSLMQDDLIFTFERALAVLRDYPGLAATSQIVQKVNWLIVDYLQDHPWIAVIDQITERYPPRTLNALAYELWRNLQPEMAAILYKKILDKYSLEVETCHKALFFLGRIYEDKKDYPRALLFYRRLLTKYDFGTYTTAALFKVPWIERLQGRHESAARDFQKALDFYNSPRHNRLKAAFPHTASFLTATRYWSAQTAARLKQDGSWRSRLEKLIEEFPFDFYAVVARGELGLTLQGLFNPRESQPVAYRMVGLGDVERKRFSRAEKLIAAGFLNYGVRELSKVAQRENHNLEFMFYLSRLFYLAGEYQKAIKISWRIIEREKRDSISGDLARGLFPEAFREQVEFWSEKSKLDVFLILSLIRQESAFNPGIVSSAKAVGLMQLMPATAREVARSMDRNGMLLDELKNPEVNIRLGTAYLKGLLTTFDGNVAFALAAYNAGPNKVKEWVALRSHLVPLEFIESIPYNETRDYVKRVIRNYYIYLTLYKKREIKNFSEILTIPND